MSKSVVLTLESRFMDEYGEYANLPVFDAHGSIVGYVGGEVPESGNPCEFNRLGDEGFTFCASAAEVVRLKAENAKLRELAVLNWEWAHSCCGSNCKLQTNGCGYQIDRECNYEREIYDRMRGLGIEVDG